MASYFNGFSLWGEEKLFSEYLIESDLSVGGFSYGAQQAFEYVYHATTRIDRLILLSPAFFQTQKPSFIRTQLHYFEIDRDSYITQFIQNVAYPAKVDMKAYLKAGKKEELEALLHYRWDPTKIERVLDRGTTIEVFLGGKDKIIDSKAAFAFFSPLVTTYLVKDAGHLLVMD